MLTMLRCLSFFLVLTFVTAFYNTTGKNYVLVRPTCRNPYDSPPKYRGATFLIPVPGSETAYYMPAHMWYHRFYDKEEPKRLSPNYKNKNAPIKFQETVYVGFIISGSETVTLFQSEVTYNRWDKSNFEEFTATPPINFGLFTFVNDIMVIDFKEPLRENVNWTHAEELKTYDTVMVLPPGTSVTYVFPYSLNDGRDYNVVGTNLTVIDLELCIGVIDLYYGDPMNYLDVNKQFCTKSPRPNNQECTGMVIDDNGYVVGLESRSYDFYALHTYIWNPY